MNLPLGVFAKTPLRAVGAFFLGLKTEYLSLWASLLFLLYAAALQLLSLSSRRSRIIHAIAAAVLCLGIVGYHYTYLVGYRAFQGYPPFIAVSFFLAFYFWIWLMSMAHRFSPPQSRVIRMLLSAGIPLFALIGVVAGQIGNYLFFANQYPTLHLFILQMTYLLLSVLVIWFLGRLRRSAFQRKTWVIIAAVLIFHLLYLAMPLATGSFVDARPKFAKYTMLGRTGHIFGARDTSGTPLVDATKLYDPEGVARFAATSNLPKLPRDFKLTDYNVLLISMEALRYDATGLCRWTKNTPNMRRLATNGSYWFDGAYTPSCVTVQVTSSIMAMGYPSTLQFTMTDKAWAGMLRTDEYTVAELMKKRGYKTFWVGHDLKMDGVNQGFQEVKRFEATYKNFEGDITIAAEAIETIKQTEKTKQKFFGWIFFASPHSPYAAHYDDMENKTDKQRYFQEIRFGDEQLGKVLDHLAKTGTIDKTVIIFHGDHGEEFRDHGGTMHFNLFSEVTHVPLLIRIPGVLGKRVEHPTSLSYIFPWLLQYGDETMTKQAQKVIRERIAPMMRETNGAVISELLHKNRMLSTLVVDKHRIMYDHLARSWELFDLRRDPGEQNDIFGDNPELTDKFESIGRKYLIARESLKKINVERSRSKKKKKKHRKGSQKNQRQPEGAPAANPAVRGAAAPVMKQTIGPSPNIAPPPIPYPGGGAPPQKTSGPQAGR